LRTRVSCGRGALADAADTFADEDSALAGAGVQRRRAGERERGVRAEGTEIAKKCTQEGSPAGWNGGRR
jgi:hypothetical protein